MENWNNLEVYDTIDYPDDYNIPTIIRALDRVQRELNKETNRANLTDDTRFNQLILERESLFISLKQYIRN